MGHEMMHGKPGGWEGGAAVMWLVPAMFAGCMVFILGMVVGGMAGMMICVKRSMMMGRTGPMWMKHGMGMCRPYGKMRHGMKHGMTGHGRMHHGKAREEAAEET